MFCCCVVTSEASFPHIVWHSGFRPQLMAPPSHSSDHDSIFTLHCPPPPPLIDSNNTCNHQPRMSMHLYEESRRKGGCEMHRVQCSAQTSPLDRLQKSGRRKECQASKTWHHKPLAIGASLGTLCIQGTPTNNQKRFQTTDFGVLLSMRDSKLRSGIHLVNRSFLSLL